MTIFFTAAWTACGPPLRAKRAPPFACPVIDPSRYGIVEFDETGHAVSIEEKPTQPKSNHAVPGLYICDNQIHEISHALKPSTRGELEIADVIREYLRRGSLLSSLWAVASPGSILRHPESLMEASTYIATLEHRQGVKIACVEEIAFYMHFIDTRTSKHWLKGSRATATVPILNRYRLPCHASKNATIRANAEIKFQMVGSVDWEKRTR